MILGKYSFGIGELADTESIQSFVESQNRLIGSLEIVGLDDPIDVTEELIRSVAEKYLFAVQKAGETYRYILQKKGNADFVPEVSMDETDAPQTPVEMLFILAMIANQKIPVQTIAPKFTGRFNKGVDYVGDVHQFAKEFEEDLAVIQFAAKKYGLPSNLKLSVHSGSDKFAIYASIQKALKKLDAGVHIKTAGTTWLEELIGLAESGGDGLQIAKDLYASAFARFDELCGPYATVIDIDPAQLPGPAEVDRWDGPTYASTLRHDQSNTNYNPHFRQLLHVGYKVASEMGDRFLQALKDNEEVIAKHVTENLWERHIKGLFL